MLIVLSSIDLSHRELARGGSFAHYPFEVHKNVHHERG